MTPSLPTAPSCAPWVSQMRDFDKPFIGVINTWTEMNPGHVHLRSLAEAAKAGIRIAGGVPFEVNTIALCDGIAQGHLGMRRILPSRNLIADSMELAVDANRFDAIVVLASCDKIVPASWMAIARLDVPAIMITGGPDDARPLPGRKPGSSRRPGSSGKNAPGRDHRRRFPGN